MVMSRDAHTATVQSIYLCRASGEGTAEVRLCRSIAEVKSFYEEMFGPEGIDDAMKDFQDDDHWCNDGHHEQLYCADWEAWRVPADFAIKSDLEAPTIPSATEYSVMRKALEYIGEYTGDGTNETPWRDIVKALGQCARDALEGKFDE